jgi:uncharacterized membrane protein YhaH (DUF805 family)
MNECFTPLRKYADFTGRASRKEYWSFLLVMILAFVITSAIDNATGTVNETSNLGLTSIILLVLLMVPGTALCVRRLHDAGHSGWWAITTFIPIFNYLASLVIGLLNTEEGENEYGSKP